MYINTTYNILKCKIFELFSYLYPYIFSCTSFFLSRCTCIHQSYYILNDKYADSANLRYLWYIVIKGIIIKKIMKKSQLNVASHQHAQWQLVSITHC